MTDPTPALRSLCMYAALAIAILTMAKLLGVSTPVIRAGITELAAVGILCAMVGR